MDTRKMGPVYESYKGVKRLFRSCSHSNMTLFCENSYAKLNQLFNKGQLRFFWRSIRKSKRNNNIQSSMQVGALADHYKSIMSDQGGLYGSDCLNINERTMKNHDKTQGNLFNQALN